MQDRLLRVLWVVLLFKPEVLLAAYVPALQPLRMLPTLLIVAAALLWFTGGRRVRFPWFALLIASALVSTVFAENTGRPRLVLRLFLEMYALGLATFARAGVDAGLSRFLHRAYALHFLYLGVWGIAGKGLVTWDYLLNEEDAFGPLMTMGLGYCFQSLAAERDRRERALLWAATLVCLVGTVASFARGAFIALVAVLLLNVLLSRAKAAAIGGVAAGALVVAVGASVLFPGNAYWQEIRSSVEGTSGGTGKDRKILWSIAWEEFKANPVFGVGPMNFGVAAPRYVERVVDAGRYRPENIWGRALHNMYLQLLCELGLVGTLLFALVSRAGFGALRRQLALAAGEGARPPDELAAWAARRAGLRVALYAFLINAFFYDIGFYSWLPELVVLAGAYAATLAGPGPGPGAEAAA